MTPSGRLVIDASVVLKWVLQEAGREDALNLLDAFEAGTVHLVAPRVLLQEVGSALSKRCRRNELTPAQTRAAWQFVDIRRPMLIENQDHLDGALELSIAHRLSFWDSLYLALAINLRCELITADGRFYRAARPHYPFFKLIGQ
jgi:predicted nucleic acid-binding protein